MAINLFIKELKPRTRPSAEQAAGADVPRACGARAAAQPCRYAARDAGGIWRAMVAIDQNQTIPVTFKGRVNE